MYIISTHVSFRRRTPDSCSRNVFVVFQFTSPRGDEQYNRVIRDLRQVFQLTSPRGDEQKNPREFAPEKIFQITSPQGDEPLLLRLMYNNRNFNSHPRKEMNLYTSLFYSIFNHSIFLANFNSHPLAGMNLQH